MLASGCPARPPGQPDGLAGRLSAAERQLRTHVSRGGTGHWPGRVNDRSLTSRMRAVQITRFGGPEVLEIVDLPDPTPGPDQKLYEVSTAGPNFAATHHLMS